MGEGRGALMPQPQAARADAARSDNRDSGREFMRLKPREPHMKYDVPTNRRVPGMDYCWAATKIRGMPNPKFGEKWRAGWRPVPAKDLPELSGLDLNPDQVLVD